MATRLLVCDLDNTLYDWVSYFVPAFYAMVDEVVRLTSCNREQLLDDLREVHRKHYDAEHPFALLETNLLKEIFPGKSEREIARALDPAFHSFNQKRKEGLRLYAGVLETLQTLSETGIVLVAHTESKLYSVVERLTRLQLTAFFKRVYCRERSVTRHPDPPVADRWLSRFPMEKVVELSRHQRKPDPEVLLEICFHQHVPPHQTAYVGDSLARDMLMAHEAGVTAIWAKYGVSNDKPLYEKLVRVTHWTDEDVERELAARDRARGLEPDYVLHGGFDELIPFLVPRGERHSVRESVG